MKKKLLVVALASAFVAQSAMADTSNVNIYGKANASFDVVNNNPQAGNGATVNKVSSNGSMIGFKGSEDLGGGTNAIWQIESQVNLDGTQNNGTAGTAATAAATTFNYVWLTTVGTASAVSILNAQGCTTTNAAIAAASAVAVNNGASGVTVSCTAAGAAAGATAATNNNNVLGSRNSFVGIANEAMGTVRLGRYDSPYKTSTRKLDAFADTIADNRSLMGGANGRSQVSNVDAITQTAVTFDGRIANSVTYTSPNMSGFVAEVQYGATSEATTAGADSKSSTWGLSAAYDMAPFYASIAYADLKHGASANVNALSATNTDSRESAWKLGLQYKVEQFEGSFVFERTRDDAGGKTNNSVGSSTNAAACAALASGADCNGHNAYYLNGKFNFSGSDAVKMAYTRAGEMERGGTAARNNTRATQWSVGYDHNMSKRTTVYALYTRLSNDTAANYTLGNNGYSTSTTAVAADSDPTAWGFGIKHNF